METMEEARDLEEIEEHDGDEQEVIDLADEEEADEVEEDACCICQDVVSVLKQGFLPSCDHRFHFDCILSWSKVTNLCPLCKQKFNTITQRDEQGAIVHTETIADTKQVFRPDPRDHDIAAQLRLVNNIRCEICGRDDDEHVLLMCEAPGCAHGSHTYCVGLSEVPSHSWYCLLHESTPRSASDLLPRGASTVSSRRRTRRLASLMSNVLTGGPNSRTQRSRTSTASRSRARSRLLIPDGDGLDLSSARPIRGVALSYALRMSRELQAVQQRADAMFARGDLSGATLYARPSSRQPPASSTEQMWQDYEQSRQLQASSTATESHTQSSSPRHPNRISPTFSTEYRDLAKRMADAVGHDNYASTVSLTIPKTARLRLVSQVKSFFTKLNDREKTAALDAGCLSLLFSWIRTGDDGGDSQGDLHPQVLDGVLSALEELSVRKEDLMEVQRYRETLDGIANQPSVSLELRERAIILSEKWREVDPPPVTAAPVRTHRGLPSNSQRTNDERPSLPTISAFKPQKHGKRKAPPTKEKPKDDRWTSVAVEYVKAKLYPLYKQSNGKISKDRFKTIVKQVVERFKRDATSMQSHILEPGDSRQLTNAAKTRLKKLLDQEYRSTGSTSQVGHPAVASSYSALPPGVKRPRIS